MADNNQDRNKLSALQQRYGDSVELLAEDGSSVEYRILAELSVDGRRYAVLQAEAMKQEDEIEPFRIVEDSDGELQLESVTDEDEWENVAEAYDDLQFGSEDQP
ncbi:DUF1292 domain-containing protein [Cohnella terricola]|uniref:DUF1292 domain-containing protein n=1 Tax=Cohnella terricola TaxID=1289167 RepID=A0A559JKS1_9BACL|nr:DUF1292 domain-containing protein [Cohnella terricola]TVY00464.1 DUF1292 domain-containing protein [Cohnella terricola]